MHLRDRLLKNELMIKQKIEAEIKSKMLKKLSLDFKNNINKDKKWINVFEKQGN